MRNKYIVNPKEKYKTTAVIIILSVAIFLILVANNKEKTHNTIQLSYDDKKYLIEVSKKTIGQHLKQGTRYNVENVPSRFFLGNKVFVSLYLNGAIRGSWSAQKTNLADSVIYATINALNDERFKKINGDEDFEKVDILLTIIKDSKELRDRDILSLSENIALGLDGVYLKKGSSSATFVPSFAVQQDWDAVTMLRNLCLKAKLKINCWEGNETKLYRFDSLTFIGRQDNYKDIYRASPLIEQKSIDKDKVYKSATDASDWQLKMQKSNGGYEYFFNPSKNYYPSGNNLIRQALAAYSMAKAYQLTNNEEYLKSAERNIDFILRHIKYDDDFAYLSLENPSNTGQVAVTMIAILELPDYKKYEKEINSFANFLLLMQRGDGSFKTYYKSNQADDFDFYPGETMLALTKLYKKTGDRRYLEAVERGFPFYKKYFDSVKHTAFYMWQTSTFYEMYELTKKKEYADFVFEMTDWMLSKQYNQKNAPYPDYVGGFKEVGGVPTFSSAVYTEGIADAYKLAGLVNDNDRVKKYEASIKLAARFILQLQFNDVNTYYIKNPENAAGAIRESLISNNLRIDYTSHSILALLKIYNDYNEANLIK